MTPLVITAHLRGPITGAPMLDALLAYVVSQRAGLVAGFGEMQPVEIPVVKEPLGRFHMISSPEASWDHRELRYIHRRFPVAEAQMLGAPDFRRIHLSAGATRSYRIPGEVAWAHGDAVRWYALAERDAVANLLESITHLGKKRSVGRGAILRWEVERAEPWGDGFPVVREGLALRPLPADWPGLVDPSLAYHPLSYPYWEHAREVLCAVPT